MGLGIRIREKPIG
uniref:Uncharacterized protein n=1 Tax=Rhizophora mucronata TaxID=61149 RepID=A0A2P2QTX6_RHIMU